MILALAIALLFVVPAIFLWIGRMIEGLTSGRTASSRRPSEGVSELTGEEWFMRPMRPMFVASVNSDIMDAQPADLAAASVAWYQRPLPPLFDKSSPNADMWVDITGRPCHAAVVSEFSI